ncbi:MAG: cupin domain-containing protein [Patescibacteria group bacterium]|nr:cupin domain-containing protein [Patescibacteria group bacterium]
MTPFYENIEKLTLENNDYRRVLYTGLHSQVVLMSVAPGDEIGMEVHHVDQFLRFESGVGKAIIDGDEFALKDGTAVLVPAGANHNVINTGKKPLKLYTVYAPANHIEGTIHHTKADADKDEADEAFGEKAGK